METRFQQARLDIHEEQIQKLQVDVQVIRVSLQSIKAHQVEQAEFRKVMMTWVKQHGSNKMTIFSHNPPKNGDGKDFLARGVAAGHTPDLSHDNLNTTKSIRKGESNYEQFFDFTRETKSLPDLSMVTMKIEETTREPKKKSETNHPLGCPDYVFFNFSPDGDEVVPLLQIRSLGNSSPIPIVMENRAVIQIELPRLYSSTHKPEKIKLAQNWANTQMVQVRAQNSQSPIASRLEHNLPIASHQEPLVNKQTVNYHGSDLRGVCNNGNGDLQSRNAKKEGSRVRKSAEIFRMIDRLIK